MFTLRRLAVLAIVAALAAPGVFAQDTKPAAPAAQQQSGPRHEDVMVAMRDGVELATTVYYPEGDGPWTEVEAWLRDRARTTPQHGACDECREAREGEGERSVA